MKTKILSILKCSDNYVSGQSICDELGVSRTAVWKVINQLKEEGYVFDAVNNKGYKIIEYPDVITKSEIESEILKGNGVCFSDESAMVIKSVEYHDEIDSTNNEAKRCAESGAEDGTLYVTECQTGGRGRRGRNWISPAGSGIWMSLLLRPPIAPTSASMLTIVAAMAISDAIKAVTKDKCTCGIKWPNDIVVNSHKVCGILTEMSAEMDCVNFVVIGIGINVNTTEFEESIKDMASSIYVQTGDKVKRSTIVAEFAKAFSKYYDKFIKSGDLSGLTDEYNKMLLNSGRGVKIAERDQIYTGVAQGINNRGELIVKKDDGQVVQVVAGEVSVRGLYGYV